MKREWSLALTLLICLAVAHPASAEKYTAEYLICYDNTEKSVPTGTRKYSFLLNSTVAFGHYEQDNSAVNGQEAIEWLVLDVQEGKALLISTYSLNCRRGKKADS